MIQHLTPGDRLSAEHLNRLANDIAVLQNVSVGSGLSYSRDSSGVYLSLSSTVESFLAIIVCYGDASDATNWQTSSDSTTLNPCPTPPSGMTGEFSDCRYWIAPATCNNTTADSFDTKINLAETPFAVANYDRYAATNLAELLTMSHTIPVGTFVRVYAINDAGSPASKRYYFSATPSPIWAKITSSTPASGNTNQWLYSWTQVQLTGTTAGTIANTWGACNLTSPLSGTSNAINIFEASNVTTGTGNATPTAILSTGWNTANFGSTTNLVAIATGTVVQLTPASDNATPPNSIYVFSAANVLQGGC
jgi:hypothetical protein